MSETQVQSRICLLIFGQLIELFSFLWLIHALFRLAPSHFHGGNLTNPIYIYACIHQQWHVFLNYMMVIFIPLKTEEFCFLIGEFRIVMNIHENKKSLMSWPTVIKCMRDWPWVPDAVFCLFLNIKGCHVRCSWFSEKESVKK